MIALDTNILVYVEREETLHHKAALKLVTELAEGEAAWAIAWPCVYEFLRVVTHPRVFDPPSALDDVLVKIEALLESPSLVMLGQGPAHLTNMVYVTREGGATGNLVHDAHIAALCLEHGVKELWTTDKDFARFPGLVAKNPFVDTTLNEPRARYWARRARVRPAV